MFFFFNYFISFSLQPGTKRDIPPHALMTQLSSPHCRERRWQRRRRPAPAGAGRSSNRPLPRTPLHPVAKPMPPPFPPRQGALRRKRVPNRPTHPSPASPPGASRSGATRIPAAGPQGATAGHDRRGGGQRAGLAMNTHCGGEAMRWVCYGPYCGEDRDRNNRNCHSCCGGRRSGIGRLTLRQVDDHNCRGGGSTCRTRNDHRCRNNHDHNDCDCHSDRRKKSARAKRQ